MLKYLFTALSVLVFVTLLWIVVPPLFGPPLSHKSPPAPPKVPACMRRAADFKDMTKPDCVGNLECSVDYTWGPNRATVNGEPMLICCPQGYSVHVVTDAAGTIIDADCTKDP